MFAVPSRVAVADKVTIFGTITCLAVFGCHRIEQNESNARLLIISFQPECKKWMILDRTTAGRPISRHESNITYSVKTYLDLWWFSDTSLAINAETLNNIQRM